ncbi:MAG TPA: GDP-mannose 4,6-dehydratase [Longimicrobiales bacterium]
MSLGSDRAVVITGGAGFIGSNLADALLRAGERVIVYDNLSRPGTEKNLRWLVQRHAKGLEVEIADIRDADRVGRVVERAHTVYHLAAQVAVTSSVTDPGHDFAVNAEGTLNVLQAARDAADPPAVLFTSTNKVYGALAGVPVVLNGTRYLFEDRRRGIAEDQPLDFHSPYGCSKGAADQYVRDYARIYDLPTCVFRMSCIYGPRQFGTEDQGWVAHFVISALSGRPITLYGDGKQVRDILFVEDLVDLMIRSARRAREEPGRIYNVGGGAGNAVSLVELLELLERELGRPVERRHAPWRPGDQRIYISDIDKLRRELDWAPRVSKEEGVRRLIAWIQENATALLPSRAARVEQPLSA